MKTDVKKRGVGGETPQGELSPESWTVQGGGKYDVRHICWLIC